MRSIETSEKLEGKPPVRRSILQLLFRRGKPTAKEDKKDVELSPEGQLQKLLRELPAEILKGMGPSRIVNPEVFGSATVAADNIFQREQIDNITQELLDSANVSVKNQDYNNVVLQNGKDNLEIGIYYGLAEKAKGLNPKREGIFIIKNEQEGTRETQEKLTGEGKLLRSRKIERSLEASRYEAETEYNGISIVNKGSGNRIERTIKIGGMTLEATLLNQKSGGATVEKASLDGREVDPSEFEAYYEQIKRILEDTTNKPIDSSEFDKYYQEIRNKK